MAPSRRHALVGVDWLAALLAHAAGAGPAPAGWTGGEFVVLGAAWGGGGDRVARGCHVPGASHIDTDALETAAPEWRLRDPGSLQRTLGGQGIAAGTTVIVYGDCQIAAARVWWILRYAGVRDVRVLDGGLRAWLGAGLPVHARPAARTPVAFSAPLRHALLATTPQVRAGIDSGEVVLADVRSPAEYAGLDSGYAYIEAAGRIPGARHAGDADDSAGLYVGADGRLCDPQRILAHWEAAGLAPEPARGRFARDVVFYCGGGWRSSLACFYAHLLGLDNARNYSDGWSGWSTVYVADPAVRGATAGWRQRSSGRPIVCTQGAAAPRS